MAWTVYGDSYDSDADFLNGTKSIRVKFNAGSILQFVRTWIVFFGNPNVTNVTMKIYSDDNGSRGTLLASSLTTLTKAKIITLQNGIKEIYFEFDKIPFDQSSWFHLVISGVSTGMSGVSHIAWKSSYPSPVYTTGLTGVTLKEYPYTLSLVGAEF